ncbi:hypothetical protein FOZ61_009887 [Perkinsus olseni]|uniref:Uncharacterized protein n=1 Tax=Perkinsus olseni TaxID=32597 RepID=A0A7J6L0F0_PEROL|nr:hypothetical protein FOZ61_009887 [Perkinsus olseni]
MDPFHPSSYQDYMTVMGAVDLPRVPLGYALVMVGVGDVGWMSVRSLLSGRVTIVFDMVVVGDVSMMVVLKVLEVNRVRALRMVVDRSVSIEDAVRVLRDLPISVLHTAAVVVMADRVDPLNTMYLLELLKTIALMMGA